METILTRVTMVFAEEDSLCLAVVRRYFVGSVKLSCDDPICELKGQLEDPYESSQSMIYSPTLFTTNCHEPPAPPSPCRPIFFY